MLRTCRLDHLSACVCGRKMYCGKTADWIRMPFGMVSGVGRRRGVLDRVMIVKGKGQFWGVNLGRPIVTNGAFALRSSHVTLRTCCCCFNS